MIISRTPLCINLMGGGSDLPAHYHRAPGAAVGAAINKYVYIAVNPAFDDGIRISLGRTEVVDSLERLSDPLIREAMKLTGVTQGVEIVSMLDAPARGTGLGATSAQLVGLLNALWAHQGIFKSQRALAEEACAIRIERLHEPVGKLYPYMAAFGGMQLVRFNPDESVCLDPVICRKETKRAFEEALMLFHTGLATDPAPCEGCGTEQRTEALCEMAEMAEEVDGVLRSNQNLDSVGELLHRGWEIKCGLALGVGEEADRLYSRAREAGALGGKFTGAAGGGCLLLWVEAQNRGRVREALSELRELPLRLEPQGSKIIYIEE